MDGFKSVPVIIEADDGKSWEVDISLLLLNAEAPSVEVEC